jgi:hypothetical protein
MKVAIKYRIKAFIQEELSSLLELLDRIVKSINDNPYTEYEDIEIKTSTSEFAVICKTLNKIPTGYTIIRKEFSCDIYTSSPEKWRKNLMFLIASQSVNVIIRVT